MKGLKGTALLVAITLATAACAGSHRATAGSVDSRAAVSSSRLILEGRVRCTATVARSVQAGSPLGLRFAVRNISHRPAKVFLGRGSLWLLIRAADGTTYDTRVPLRNELGPLAAPTTIAPGKTTRVPWIGKYLFVRWRGPLQVTPGCGQTALPVKRVGVTAPGPPPDERKAVADAVAESGGLLDHCRPERAGVAVQGLIYPPASDAPPMPAKCSVSLQNEGDFLVAQVLIATPPGVDVHVRQPYEQMAVHHASPFETSAWAFVVTKRGATPVAATEADATKPSHRFATYWTLTGSEWKKTGDSRCGGSGGSEGGSTPTVVVISICPA